MQLSLLNIQNTAQAQAEILRIDSTPAGAAIMKDKAVFKTVKLTGVDCRAANILKQTFLSKGGEAAVSRACANLSAATSDVIIMATVHQYRQAIPVLKMQPWKLKEAAQLLEQMLREA